MESKSLTQKEIEKRTKGSLNEHIYSKVFSKQRWGPGHRGAEYDVCHGPTGFSRWCACMTSADES